MYREYMVKQCSTPFYVLGTDRGGGVLIKNGTPAANMLWQLITGRTGYCSLHLVI